MSTPLRKYHTAAGLSASSEQRLHQLEQRFRQLDDELAAVEAVIEQRFPLLGLGDYEMATQPDAAPDVRAKRTSRSRIKPR